MNTETTVQTKKDKAESVSDSIELPETVATLSWHSVPAEKVLEQLHVTAEGLSSEEATQRLQQFGPNALREAKPIYPLAILLGQFNSLMIWLLIGAGVVSGLLGEWIDSIAILTIVILNAVIGFFQEYKAERAIEALKKMTSPRARVRRDGGVVMLPAVEIVPGDIIELEAGDLVPADARLLDAASLKCVEAALTGESDAVNKHAAALVLAEVPLGNRLNMVFMGTSVAAGTGRAVITATGMETEFGHIAGLLQEASFDEGTPLQRRLASVGRMLVWASLGVVGVIFMLGFLRRIPLVELYMTSVSLAVAAVPEGLPALALATDPIDPDVMNHPPRRRSEFITDRKFFVTMMLTGLLTAGVSLAAYLYGLRYHDLNTARTFAFATLVYAEILRSFGCRSETKTVWELGLRSNLRLA